MSLGLHLARFCCRLLGPIPDIASRETVTRPSIVHSGALQYEENLGYRIGALN